MQPQALFISLVFSEFEVNLITFAKEVKSEAYKVSWPSYKEAWAASLIVLIVSVISGAFLFMIDAVAYSLVHRLLGL